LPQGKGLQTVPKKGSDEMLISVLITQLVQIKKPQKSGFLFMLYYYWKPTANPAPAQHHRLYQPTC
jgi:hypothetical protein